MPLLLQGLDALSRHVDKINSKGGQGADSTLRFNPLVWLAQYLLRNHPRHVKDHRTPMYEQFSELANIERGRRCLLRQREQMEVVWHEMLNEKRKTRLRKSDLPTLFKRLDAKWYLEGALLEKLPQDFSVFEFAPPTMKDDNKDETDFTDFWQWFEEFVKTNDILRASAFIDAERRQIETERKARKAEEDAERRARAMKEALEQRSELEEHFETVTADMYINSNVARIMNKGHE